jgi:hypothetical protein
MPDTPEMTSERIGWSTVGGKPGAGRLDKGLAGEIDTRHEICAKGGADLRHRFDGR